MKKLIAFGLVAVLSLSMVACGAKPEEKPAEAASSAASEAASSAEEGAAADLNSMSLDDLIAQAQAEGDVQSVGMPDDWADWGSLWAHMESEYGITHADVDMSSAEELQMFATEGENATKDIGDVGYAFTSQVMDEDLTIGYKTSYWDSVPDWAKGEDGKWMVAYTGATTFLVNTDLIEEDAPTSWEDIKNGSYKVAIGDINGGTAQGAIVASNFALGGDLENIDPAIEFWTKMAEDGRINSLDIIQQNFETGEVPVGVVWSFSGIPYSKNITNYKMVANVPTDGAILNGYASVINKYAPHPAAAALTREVMFSDAGQTFLANAGGVPTRTDVEIEGFDASAYENAIPITDPAAYSACCEQIVARWTEEVLPLINQ